ncbi:hypothetical protein DMA11_23285 [Marinilabiliaceae bacterium JC017]|nr:hypothetical protein DMA11_23285 [Marinilabiliaceae bacterium JC017]
MKYLLLLTLLIIAVVSCHRKTGSKKQRDTWEKRIQEYDIKNKKENDVFYAFINEFNSDTSFQISNAVFPLQYKCNSDELDGVIVTKDITNMKVENKLFINDEDIKLLGDFSVKIIDDREHQYSIPISDSFVDLRTILQKEEKFYHIEFSYEDYVLQAKLFSAQILSKDQTIWNWIIREDSLKTKCNLRVDFIQSELEYLFPVECIDQ